VSAAGELVASTPIALPAASMLHDFAVTATRVVFFDSPLIFDPSAIDDTGSPWRWSESHGARVGVMPRNGTGKDIRWFPIVTAHLSHASNAWDVAGDPGDGDGYETGDQVVVTGTRLTGPTSLPVLHQWTIDLVSGRVSEERLDDAASEYPRVAESRTGLEQRYTYTASFVMAAEPERSLIYKYDLSRGAARTTHRFPDAHTCGEPVFVPRWGGRREDDGYLLTFVHDRSTGLSYLAVLDAADLAAAPLAEVHLPVRVPAGFHGTWLPA
jgi:carotenoid cleavage dioxygenase